MLQQQMTVQLPLLHKQHKKYHGFAEGNYFTFITIVLSVIVYVQIMKMFNVILSKRVFIEILSDQQQDGDDTV